MRRPRLARVALGLIVGGLVAMLAACGAAEPRGPATDAHSQAALSQRFPELVNVRPQKTGPSTYDFVVLVSSPYDSPQRYADGWRVLDAGGGKTLAEMRLAHPHADEQPFWRRQSDVRVPRRAKGVQLEGHDSRNGYGGRRLTVSLP